MKEHNSTTVSKRNGIYDIVISQDVTKNTSHITNWDCSIIHVVRQEMVMK